MRAEREAAIERARIKLDALPARSVSTFVVYTNIYSDRPVSHRYTPCAGSERIGEVRISSTGRTREQAMLFSLDTADGPVATYGVSKGDVDRQGFTTQGDLGEFTVCEVSSKKVMSENDKGRRYWQGSSFVLERVLDADGVAFPATGTGPHRERYRAEEEKKEREAQRNRTVKAFEAAIDADDPDEFARRAADLKLTCNSQPKLRCGTLPLLTQAVVKNKIKIVESLLAQRADPNLRTLRGSDRHGVDATPLTAAACRGYFDVAHLLLDHGANPHQTVPSGDGFSGVLRHRTPLYVLCRRRTAGAASAQVVRLAKRLLEGHTVQYGKGDTPLFVAARCANPELVKLLLPHFRGDLNERDARHVSILSKIALLGPSSAPWESNTLLCDEDLAVARLLLEAGAQIVPPHDGPPLTSHTSDDCLSPLSIVRDVRVLDLLLEFGADVARPLPIVDYSTTEKHPLKDEAPYPLWNVLRPFRRDVAQRMIDARANVNAALPNGWTIFDHYDRQYHHTFYGESGALTFLLEAGARFGLEVETSPGVFELRDRDRKFERGILFSAIALPDVFITRLLTRAGATLQNAGSTDPEQLTKLRDLDSYVTHDEKCRGTTDRRRMALFVHHIERAWYLIRRRRAEARALEWGRYLRELAEPRLGTFADPKAAAMETHMEQPVFSEGALGGDLKRRRL